MLLGNGVPQFRPSDKGCISKLGRSNLESNCMQWYCQAHEALSPGVVVVVQSLHTVHYVDGPCCNHQWQGSKGLTWWIGWCQGARDSPKDGERSITRVLGGKAVGLPEVATTVVCVCGCGEFPVRGDPQHDGWPCHHLAMPRANSLLWGECFLIIDTCCLADLC